MTEKNVRIANLDDFICITIHYESCEGCVNKLGHGENGCASLENVGNRTHPDVYIKLSYKIFGEI